MASSTPTHKLEIVAGLYLLLFVRFSYGTDPSVTVREGDTAVLPCSVENLEGNTVIWTDEHSIVLSFMNHRIAHNSRHGFIPLFLLLLMLIITIFIHPALNYKFNLRSIGHPDLISSAIFAGVKSSILCGALCARARQDDGINPMCEAYRYTTSNGRCQLYVTQEGAMDASGVPVYKYYSVDEDPTDGFDYTVSGGHTYIYYISSNTMNFLTARDHCKYLGGYLINFDSPEEFDIMVKFVQDKGLVWESLWVGAQDLDVEGNWVTDKHNRPLDFGIWKFNPLEPNDSGGVEDCGSFVVFSQGLNDGYCGSTFKAMCERTP